MNSKTCGVKLSEHPRTETYPIVKWAGGKRGILSELLDNMPESYGRYFEPFVGGGALFFRLQPENAYISDTNGELVALYLAVRDNAEELVESLSLHENSKEYFMRIRNADRTAEYEGWSNVRKASRLVYLNRTCFNGLYRVNSKGYFNVPFGNYGNPKIADKTNILNCSKLLRKTEIRLADFSAVLDLARRGDFVYFDPPYAPLGAASNFTSYTKEGFGARRQTELCMLCKKLDSMGVKFMLSNSDTEFTNELYSGFEIKKVFAARAINSKADGRGKISEILVKNYG